ncbi:MAG: PD40 domain-containing protein [Flavobacteriales bacterium]|nr:PD40 domain-containing protein [Flavobacteriales bacterium]
MHIHTRYISVILCAALISGSIRANDIHDTTPPSHKPVFAGIRAGLSLGLLHNYGEIKQNGLLPIGRNMNENQLGICFSLQKNVSNAVAVKGMIVGGRLQGTNRDLTLVSDEISRGAYFNTSLFETTLGVQVDFYHLIMPWVINPNRKVRVEGYATIGFATFDSQIYKLKDQQPVSYLRKGIANTGKTREVVVPLGLQVAYQLTPKLDVSAELGLRITATDKLDGWIETGSKNDKYSFVGLGVLYRPGAKVTAKPEYVKSPDQNFSMQDIVKMWKAQRAYKEKNHNVALALYQELYANNETNAYLNYKLGLTELKLGNKQEAITYLNKAHELDPMVAEDIHFQLGQAFHYAGVLDSARKHYNLYRYGLLPEKIEDDPVNTYLDQVSYAEDMMLHPVDVTIENMDKAINTQYPEYSPSVTADGKTLIFTSRRPNTTGKAIDINDHQYYEDIYYSQYMDSSQTWTEATNLKGSLNTNYHDASLSISPDGSQIYVYKNTPNRTKSGDIFVSRKADNGKWSTPVSLGKGINTSYFESSASVTPDGKVMYFVSERKNGYGRGDIYKSYRDENDVRHIENLGPVVNTAEDEIGVFIHPDGKTLYFSSRGHHSMGGYDIFMTVFEDGHWSEPENLGYPINTVDDNVHFILTSDGQKAYYSSVEPEGMGDNDIYEVDMSSYQLPSVMKLEESDPVPYTPLGIVSGTVTDVQTGKPIMAEITFRDTYSNQKEIHASSTSAGEFRARLFGDPTYILEVRNDLYVPVRMDSIRIGVRLELMIEMERKERLPEDVTPDVFAVRNIQFEFEKGSSKLVILQESRKELDKLIDYMKRVKSFQIEVAGHTDNSGKPEFNMKLSKERARVVGDYFINHGVEGNRVKVLGYGDTVPVESNETEEGRARNRRVEVRILE